jgi:hypothetical protein
MHFYPSNLNSVTWISALWNEHREHRIHARVHTYISRHAMASVSNAYKIGGGRQVAGIRKPLKISERTSLERRQRNFLKARYDFSTTQRSPESGSPSRASQTNCNVQSCCSFFESKHQRKWQVARSQLDPLHPGKLNVGKRSLT